MALNLPGKFTKVFTDNVSMENASIDSINTPNIDIGTGASLIASDEYLQTGGDYSLTTNTIPFSQWSGSVFSPPYFLPGRLFEISSSGTNTYATALSQSGTASVIFTTPSVLGISASFNHGNATVPLVGTVVTGSIYKPTGSLGNLGGTTLNLEAYIHTTTNIPGGGNGSAYFGYIGHTFIIQKSVNAGSSWTNLKSGSINWNYNTSVPVPVNSTNPLILQTTDLSPTTSSLYRLVVSSSVPFGFGYNGATGVGGFIQISEDSYFKVTQNTYNAPALKVQGTTEFLNDIIVRGSASFDGGIIYQATIVSSGSNILGDNPSDTQTLIGTINLTGPVTVNSSYGLTANTVTASIISASNGITGSLFGTSSWAQSASNALRSISASRADTASFLPVGTYQITSSWAQSASNAINAQTASFLPVETYQITSSWAQSASNALRSISASRADTASFLPVGTYQITSSWAQSASNAINAQTASFLPVGTYQITSSWAVSASQALTASFVASTGNAFVQGGNSFGTTALLGTNDSQSLQLETSGSVRMTISSSGNVGIGTTSPAALLDVSGNTIIRGALTASNISASSWISGSDLRVANSATVGTTLQVIGATTLVGALTASNISASGNISSSTLHVTGNENIGGTSTITGRLNANSGITTTTITASGAISSSAGLLGTTVTATSNVTVGGTLSVTGSTTLTGALTASIISASSWISGSDLRVANSATVGTTLRVTGATTLIGALTASNISASSWISGSDLRVANSASIGGTLGVTGVSTFADDLNSPTFFSGFAGSGWKLDSIGPKYSFEVDDLTVRGTMKVYELLISQIRATNGSIFVSNTGKVETVTDLGNNTYYLTFDTGSQYGHSFKVGDIIRAQRFNITASTIYQCNLVVAGVPSTQALTASFNGTYGTSSYGIGIYGAGTASITAPTGGMEFVRLGSTVDTNRQGTVYLTADDNNAPFVDVKDGVTSHDGFNTANTTKVRMGKLDGITSPLFGQLSGYGLWASGSAYLEGTINATAGKIGGFTITNDAISGTGFFLSGSATGNDFFISSSNFNVKADGTITASNATLSGTITANAGAIGGWRITDSQISSSGIILTTSSAEDTTAAIITSLQFPGLFSNGSSTSGSININGIEFYATSSLTLPPNESTRIYFYLQNGVSLNTTNINAIHAITASLNFSSSISTYSSSLSDITASRTVFALILQAKTPGPVGDSYYVTPVIPSSSTTYFTGGSGTANILIGSALGLNTGSGVYLGGQGYFRVGDPNGKRIRWDNNDLLISSSNFTLINGNITASNATLSGTITANAGRIGGFAITQDAITGSGFFLSGSAIGNDFFISASNFNVKANGTITASAGLIGGFNTTTTEIKTTGSITAIDNDTRTSITYPNLSLDNNGNVTGSSLLLRKLIPSASTFVSYKLVDTETGIADFKNIGRPILNQGSGNITQQAGSFINNTTYYEYWYTLYETAPCYLLPGENLLLIAMQIRGDVGNNSAGNASSTRRARHNVRILLTVATGSNDITQIGKPIYSGVAGNNINNYGTGWSNPSAGGNPPGYFNNFINQPPTIGTTFATGSAQEIWKLFGTAQDTNNQSIITINSPPSGSFSIVVTPSSSLGVAIIPTASRGQYVKFFIQSYVSQSTTDATAAASAFTQIMGTTLTTARGYTAASVGGGVNTFDPNSNFGLKTS